ncbi:MAG: hypothetical protein E6H95_10095 [Chloroflexi bacterium]|nr:MAG: hypothetical protein E6H95_10095 [Chloroflexota bacterium]
MDLHLGRRECGRQVAANREAGGGGRRGGRGGGRLRYRGRSLRAVGRGARKGGGGGGTVARRPRRRNRLVLLDPIEEPHPISRLKGGEVVLRVYLLLAHASGRGDRQTCRVRLGGRCSVVLV